MNLSIIGECCVAGEQERIELLKTGEVTEERCAAVAASRVDQIEGVAAKKCNRIYLACCSK